MADDPFIDESCQLRDRTQNNKKYALSFPLTDSHLTILGEIKLSFKILDGKKNENSVILSHISANASRFNSSNVRKQIISSQNETYFEAIRSKPVHIEIISASS